ncbi:MAG: hypothetical protein GZ088_09435 [Acidipila sp.]|nr:hypothetical protein [Acidipila sp.]
MSTKTVRAITDRPVVSVSGVRRYKANKVVVHCLAMAKQGSKFDLNILGDMFGMGLFSIEDYNEFMQLIGYSVNGYNEVKKS